jgi:probable rRNA maturation factor
MKIEINKLVPEKIDLGFLKRVAEKTLKLMKFNVINLGVVLVDSGRMKDLNKKYRKKDKVTDVLTFDYGHQFGGQGEIIICLPQAKKQAQKLGHSLEKELAILLIHGILHLAGYNDETKKDFNKMKIKQEGIWQKIKL